MSVLPSLRRFGSLLLLFALLGCQPQSDIRSLTVIYTNDEHGYMEGMREGENAATLLQLWRENLDYQPDGAFLLLSGGDNWTGPAISSWTGGESMTQVMTAMGYDASAVGNHEFDFGLDTFQLRSAEAGYDYLSANTRWKVSNQVPVDLGILPFNLIQVNQLRVGIIGLTTTSTPYTTNPAYVQELSFTQYEPAVREAYALLLQQDPDLVFVIGHVCLREIEPLAAAVADLDIALFGAGHCNELAAKQVGESLVVGGGYHFSSYATASFQYDLQQASLVDSNAETHQHQGAALPPDTGIAAIIDRWQSQFEDILGEVIAVSEQPISHQGTALPSAVVQSWLWANPEAHVAITNLGGLRAPLPAGEIRLSHLVNLMPFDNSIIALQLSGADLQSAIEQGGRPVVAGMQRDGNQWIMQHTSEPLEATATYRVLVNSFMYSGGDNFGLLAQADPEGYDTGVSYRQPFVDWLRNETDLTRLYE